MTVHDIYARRTPYELALPSLEFADEHFPKVVEEAEGQGFPGHLTDRDAFPLLAEVGVILKEIQGDADPAAMIREHGSFLYHAFHLWRTGLPLVLVSESAARRAVSATESGAIDPDATGCVYLQLPQHLFWVSVSDEGAPESLDGIFAVWTGGRLDALAVAGISPGRSGFVTIPTPAISLSDLQGLSETPIREGGNDFAHSLPGGDIDQLYGVESAGELLKLIARLVPDLASAQPCSPGSSEDRPTPSVLVHRRLP